MYRLLVAVMGFRQALDKSRPGSWLVPLTDPQTGSWLAPPYWELTGPPRTGNWLATPVLGTGWPPVLGTDWPPGCELAGPLAGS